MIAFVLAFIASYVTMLLPRKVREKITLTLNMLESIPDVLLIGAFTALVLAIYDQTGTRLFHIVASRDVRIYAMPIMVLSILPALFFYRIMIYDFEEEWSKSYIDLAKVKGLSTSEMLFRHIFRNAIISFFLHSKSILWFMLSNLLLVEYVFNLSGLMYFMFENHTAEILTVGLLLIFVRIQALAQIVIEKVTNRQIEL